MNHYGSVFRASGPGPHTALAPRWLIACALVEGRAPLNGRAHLGAIRPCPALYLAISLFLSASLPPLVSLSRHQSAADFFWAQFGRDVRDEPWRAHGASARRPFTVSITRRATSLFLRQTGLNSHPTVPTASGRHENPRW